jgi:hypothetical protein
MASDPILFEGRAGLDLFLDTDVYVIKEKGITQVKEEDTFRETLFPEINEPPITKTTAKLLILVENAVKTTKSAKEIDFLTKLVNAVGLHMKDVSILSATEASSVEAKKALIFYATKEETAQIPFIESYNQEFKKYEPFTVYNQQVLWADAIDNMLESVEMKKMLWSGLKKMYGLG